MPLQSPAKKREEELEKKLKEIQLKEEEDQYAESAKNLGLPFSTLKGVPIDTEALNMLDEETARKSGLAILYRHESKLIIALINPDDPQTKETLAFLKTKGFVTDILL